MANQSNSSTIERLLDAIVDQLTPEAAKVVLDLYAPDEIKARIDALVEKLMQGGDGLAPAEQDEYDGLMQVVHTISMIQDRIEFRAGATAISPGAVPASVSPPKAVMQNQTLDDVLAAPRPSVTPTLKPHAAAGRFEGLEAMLDDLDDTIQPGRSE